MYVTNKCAKVREDIPSDYKLTVVAVFTLLHNLTSFISYFWLKVQHLVADENHAGQCM